MRAMSLVSSDGEGEQNELRCLQEKLESTMRLVSNLTNQLTELKEQVRCVREKFIMVINLQQSTKRCGFVAYKCQDNTNYNIVYIIIRFRKYQFSFQSFYFVFIFHTIKVGLWKIVSDIKLVRGTYVIHVT